VTAWRSATGWLDALRHAVSSSDGAERRRQARVALGTLLRVARADAAAADASTGRGVATSHETVAGILGMSGKTVQRARQLIEALGFSVTIAEGRYLTTAERAAAREAHGGYQVRAASLRALTLPAPPVRNVHLPRRGHVLSSSPVRENSPRRAAAARPPASKRSDSPAPRFGHRSIEMQRLAARLVDGSGSEPTAPRMPWLLRTRTGGRRHIGALCDVLGRAGIDPSRWTPRALVDAIDAWHRQEERRTLAGGAADPLAYFAWQLRQAVDPHELTPVERSAIEREQRAADRAAALAEAAAEHARLAADDGSGFAEFQAARARIAARTERWPRRHPSPATPISPIR